MQANTVNNQLTISNLGCRRGERVLFKQLSFELQSGQILYIQGENGSGKTTLLRTLCGLSTPAAGSIEWNAEKIQTLAEDYHGQILYIGHLPSIKDDLTVVENIQFSAALSGYTIDHIQVMTALDDLGVQRCANLPARVLSQGQRRRIALAQLWLLNNPAAIPLWILDEPFTALDINMIKNLTQHIEKYVKKGGMVVLTSHQEPSFSKQLLRSLHLGDT